MEISSLSLLEPEDRYATKLGLQLSWVELTRFELAGFDLITQLAFLICTDLSELGFYADSSQKTKVGQKYFQNHA